MCSNSSIDQAKVSTDTRYSLLGMLAKKEERPSRRFLYHTNVVPHYTPTLTGTWYRYLVLYTVQETMVGTQQDIQKNLTRMPLPVNLIALEPYLGPTASSMSRRVIIQYWLSTFDLNIFYWNVRPATNTHISFTTYLCIILIKFHSNHKIKWHLNYI